MIDIAEDNLRAMRGMVKPIYMDDPETMPAVEEGDEPTPIAPKEFSVTEAVVPLT